MWAVCSLGAVLICGRPIELDVRQLSLVVLMAQLSTPCYQGNAATTALCSGSDIRIAFLVPNSFSPVTNKFIALQRPDLAT